MKYLLLRSLKREIIKNLRYFLKNSKTCAVNILNVTMLFILPTQKTNEEYTRII